MEENKNTTPNYAPEAANGEPRNTRNILLILARTFYILTLLSLLAVMGMGYLVVTFPEKYGMLAWLVLALPFYAGYYILVHLFALATVIQDIRARARQSRQSKRMYVFLASVIITLSVPIALYSLFDYSEDVRRESINTDMEHRIEKARIQAENERKQTVEQLAEEGEKILLPKQDSPYAIKRTDFNLDTPGHPQLKLTLQNENTGRYFDIDINSRELVEDRAEKELTTLSSCLDGPGVIEDYVTRRLECSEIELQSEAVKLYLFTEFDKERQEYTNLRAYTASDDYYFYKIRASHREDISFSQSRDTVRFTDEEVAEILNSFEPAPTLDLVDVAQ